MVYFAKLLQQNWRNEYTLVTSSGNMEAVVCDVVSPEDLLKFEKKYSTELAKGDLTKDTKFEYAWCLIRSNFPDDINKGIVLLDELVHKGTKDDQRDYLFYLAIGNYKLKEYERGLKCIRILLKNEPGNTQALDLEKLIVKAMRKDGLVGMAIVGGIVGGVGLGVAGLAALIGMAASKKL
ncbi:mitochondrial fission 1 protein isoform X1 [Salmo salar]|uniref:Mitochondrial fission 1 protein n=1 Tax=Salmo salar TaxID=8030 RepID=B5X9E2_SALSA|nr:mitochondrial fission 1 protein isoform X1 [Salmo salar]ACI67462.1 Mitochondrial fission 1 protein [Salmo salar]|eukprot:XP_014051264.1 PREDICTED: mitochondrial fission 1 protein isoform X1 [Salmo salar]